MSNFKSVILVDDDEDDRMVFRDIVHSVYPNIIFNDFNSADASLAFLECDHIMKPDLIFMDVNMPVKDGFFLLRYLRKREYLRDIPVIMFSTSSDPEDIEQARKLGAVGYAVKPSEVAKLTDIIKIVSERILYTTSPDENLVLL
ncbi:response regulator [Flavobacterium sp. RHBU_3]|uniref:response regulator n=1 Tax=Flavobacterium sp. RHBU_3 TaxID=3391184 RepID=UPI003984B365